MAVQNAIREIPLDDSDRLNLPATSGISVEGYWYYYQPADFDSNNVLAGNRIVAWKWDSDLQNNLPEDAGGFDIDGTIAYVDERWNQTDEIYHGGSIIHIGAGVNDITNQSETDAFFFGHIGTYEGGLEDDAFYWDRLYEVDDSAWFFYQYHKHLPSNYNEYDDGRFVMAADEYISPTDKQYAYLIAIKGQEASKYYSIPLARIHTPSIGGAHNSHNDVTLPQTTGFNYMPAGIIAGSSNRFHAFYIRDEDSDGLGNERGFRVFSRTFTSTSNSFGSEINYGIFDLGTPTFDPYPGGVLSAGGVASKYPMRVSNGVKFGTRIYFPVIINAGSNALTWNIDVDNQGNNYRLTGSDRNGTINSGTNNPSIEINVGDTVNFDVPSNVANVHPFYIKYDPVLGTGSQVGTGTDTSQSTATNQGASGGAIVSWTPIVAGTYYYVCSVHSGMYGQITVTAAAVDTFDLQVWSVTDANTISPGTLERVDITGFDGMGEMPDAFMTTVGTNMYMAVSDINNGGVKLLSTIDADSSGAWVSEGNIVSNTATSPIRVHGLKYNSENTKFYTLLSGDVGASGTYDGKGLYSFDLAGGAFDGYEHLDYLTSDPDEYGSFINKEPLATGHIRYDQQTGTLTRFGTSEPEGIPNNTSILQYEVGSAEFFNKKEINTKSEEYLFQGIYLSDGRKALVGRVEDHPQNEGEANTGDLLLTIVDNEGNDFSYTWGGTGDDFITGVIEDVENNRIVLTGYCKGELAHKGDQEVHGWIRNIKDSVSSYDEHAFTGVVRDSDGGYFLSATDTPNERIYYARYNKNYDFEYARYFSIGANQDTSSSIAQSHTGDLYFGGSTFNGTSASFTDALIIKTTREGSVIWNKTLGTGTTNYATVDIDLIYSSGIEYTVVAISAGTQGDQTNIMLVLNSNGDVIFRKVMTGFYVTRVKPERYDTGRFLITGAQTPVNGGEAFLYLCDINDPSFVVWEHSTSKFVDGDLLDVELLRYDSDTSTNEYITCGSSDSGGFVYKMVVTDSALGYGVDIPWENRPLASLGTVDCITSLVVEDSDKRLWWWDEIAQEKGQSKVTNKQVYLVGQGTNMDSDGGILMNTDTYFFSINDSDGSINWANTLGHMGVDKLDAQLILDKTGKHFVWCGSSTSHSQGQDAVFGRLWTEGFGTGVYHTDASTSNAYYYDSYNLVSNLSLSPTGYAFDDAITVSETSTAVNSIGSVTSISADYATLEYNGTYGANGLFNAFLAWVNKDDLQSFLNTDEYAEDRKIGRNIHRANNLFNVRQISTVGDATADDGNIFSYDVIKSSDGEYYYVGGQVSGNVARTNTGASGVYDYWLGQYDIATDEFRWWQNGSSSDEEIYAIEELQGGTKQGHIAFCGRTTGNLPGVTPNIGGYDLFLGIFDPDPITWSAEYYSNGSGFNDKAMNLHDMHDIIPNNLVLVYNTFGSVQQGDRFGSEDIGVITFNYETDVWGTGQQTGSETSEEIDQNGKPSTKLPDGRIAVVCNTSGAFGDDANTFGLLDIGLGIFSWDSDGSGNYEGWKNYQVGSGSADFSYSVDNNGSTLLITGFSEATFDKELHGIIVEFDPSYGLTGKARS